MRTGRKTGGGKGNEEEICSEYRNEGGKDCERKEGIMEKYREWIKKKKNYHTMI